MNRLPQTALKPGSNGNSGFTMIEIALSLAVIGFALVAIIGVLPTGMEVQKQNRQETIINQDAGVWLDALRNGERGLDDLTNYVVAITNYRSSYLYQRGGGSATFSGSKTFGYTGRFAPVSDVVLTNGQNIVGLLSTPKYTPIWAQSNKVGFYSNTIVAWVRSMSGPANEKYPQTNLDVQGMALTYRMVPEIIPYSDFDRDWTNYTAYQGGSDTNAWISRSNYFTLVTGFQANLRDIRLTFRWPYYSGNGKTGNGWQVFRTQASGIIQILGDETSPRSETNRYFLSSQSY